MEKCNLVYVHGTIFKENKAALGGAVYVLAADDKQTHFNGCGFSGNRAGDGGAVYLYTGPGVDIFTKSIFRNNFARETSRHSHVYLMQLPGMVARYCNKVESAR